MPSKFLEATVRLWLFVLVFLRRFFVKPTGHDVALPTSTKTVSSSRDSESFLPSGATMSATPQPLKPHRKLRVGSLSTYCSRDDVYPGQMRVLNGQNTSFCTQILV